MATSTEKKNDQEQSENSNFECNICLDIASDAVVSLCGHLFCWPCLHKWLETRPNRQMCPVCKAGIDKDKVIPIYGKDNPDRKDPREKLPPRPSGQRTEPQNNFNPLNFGNFGAFGGHNQFQFSFGIGAFPFSLISWGFGNQAHATDQQTPQQQQDEQFLSRAFLWIAMLFLIWLVLA